jgi:hypothetical protein
MHRDELIRRIHDSAHRGVLVATGGGSLVLSDLLQVPGASATVLEARVPYHANALAEFLGAAPDQAASAATALDLAMAAFVRAKTLAGGDDRDLFGLSVTASLATTRAKRGEHRVHVATQTRAATRSLSLDLAKGARTRAQEEALCRDLALAALAQVAGIDSGIALDLRANERIDEERVDAQDGWRELIASEIAALPHPDSAAYPRALLPGAFNPLHDGHRAMAADAALRLSTPVAYELCVRNVDKPPLHYLAIAHRLAQFEPATPVWLTSLPTFVAKARHFPHARFVVGVDTIVRIADPRYYGGDPIARDQAITELRELGASFLVYGRRLGRRFTVLEDLTLPAALQSLCEGVPEEAFRSDDSSTALRKAGLPKRA